MEIQSTAELAEWLAAGRPLGGVRLQDVDLGPVEADLLRETRLGGLVVLGGAVSRALLVHLQQHGAVVFPGSPDTPVDVYRAHLYTGRELYAGLDEPGGYAATVDSRAYEWARDRRLAGDAYATLLKAMHDDSVSDALDEWVAGRRVVGIMGGPQPSPAAPAGTRRRPGPARSLAEAGLLVATGGGPGAMEAANLGRGRALGRRARTRRWSCCVRCRPSLPDVGAWVRVAFEVVDVVRGWSGGSRRREVGVDPAVARRPDLVLRPRAAERLRRGHREVLLQRGPRGRAARAVERRGDRHAGGRRDRAGGVPARDPALLRAGRSTPPPLVLVGVDHWVETLPVWPLLRAMAQGPGRWPGRSTSSTTRRTPSPW